MNKKYWLKGALVAVIIHIVVSLVIVSMIGFQPTDNRDLAALEFPNVFFGIPMIFLVIVLGFDFGYWSILLYLIIYWFIVGSIIGWIYGKVNARKLVGN